MKKYIIGMEEAPENGKESSHSARANGMNECDVKPNVLFPRLNLTDDGKI
jgi:hypothetical protein